MDIGAASELIIGKLAGCSHEGFAITGDLAAQVLKASKSGLEYRTRNGRSGIEKCIGRSGRNTFINKHREKQND